jgi:hypothetical protein
MKDRAEARSLIPADAEERRRAACALDDLYAEAVGERNRLMPRISGFSWAAEQEVMIAWEARAMPLLQQFATVREISDFRTLNMARRVNSRARQERRSNAVGSNLEQEDRSPKGRH